MAFFTTKSKIDPALLEQLKKRGMTAKIKELQDAEAQTSVAKHFLPAVAETITKLPIPGRQLATGLGYAMAKPYTEKMARDTEQTQSELQDTLIKEIKQAKITNNFGKQQRLKKIATDLNFPNVQAETLTDAPTTKQILASAGELALLAATGYKPYLPTGKLVYGTKLKQIGGVYKAIKGVEQAEKLVKMSTLGKVGAKFALPVAKQAAIGAGFFGVSKATEKDATINDIIKSAEKGAIIGGAVTAGAIGLGETMGYLGKKYGPAVSAKWQKTMAGLEKTATGEAVETTNQVDKTLSYVGVQPTTFKQKTAQVTLKGINTLRQQTARWVDRFAPAKRIEARISQLKGLPLTEEEKIYRDMRLLTAVSDASAENKILDLVDNIKGYDDVTKRKALAWMTQLDFIDRVKLGQKVAGDQSLDDLLLGLEKLKQEIGPDMKNVAQIKNAVYTHNVKLLQERVNAGVISDEFKNILLKAHPNYIRHDVILAADEKVAQGLSGSLNVGKTDIIKAIGSAKNISDPLEATARGTQIATRIIEKNKILNNFIKAQEEYDLFPGMRKLLSGYKPQINFDTINFFRNGVKETWQIPADIAIAIKNLDAPITPGWWKMATSVQWLLKKGATEYNPSFTLPNLFRDRQTAAITARGFIESIAQKTGVSPQALNMSDAEIKSLYKASGGYGASIFKEGESKILDSLQKSGITKVLDSANPLKIIDKVNEYIELSTREAVFKQALQRGLSAKDAALVSREATIDFAKMGTWMRPLNQAIPFLNARVQGFINLPKAFVSNPEVFARMQMYTAVYPTLALHQHNRRFDSYANISPYLKNKYWIIMTGETDGTDSYTGDPIKIPQFVTVPKGEGQALVAGPIQWYLEKADKVDYRKTSEMIADTIGSASPLEFQTWGQGNIWLKMASQLGPTVSIPAGLATGKVPYSGYNMIPPSRQGAEPYMQFAKNTPEIIKDAGKILGKSPAQMDFIISSFGGLPQDVTKAIDIVYGVVRGGKIGGNSISETPWGSVTQIPVAKRFIRESGDQGSEQQFRTRQKEKIQTGIDTEKLKIYDKAEEIWQEMNKKKTREEKLNYLNSFGDKLTPEIRDRIAYLKKYRQTFESLKPTDSVELRARYILQRLDEMKDMGTPKEDRIKFLYDLEENKILSQKVKDMIYQIQNP